MALENVASGSDVTTKDVTKEFRWADCPSGVRMAIIVPNPDLFRGRRSAVIACAQACENKGVSWVSIYHQDVTPWNLTVLLNMSSIKYVYWCGHGNNVIGGVARTYTECWRDVDEGWWDFFNNWERTFVFSYTRQTIPDAPLLPDNWDDRGFDLYSLGMYDENYKKIVFIDACYSGVWTDMAGAYGAFYNFAMNDHIYIGWRIAYEALPDVFPLNRVNISTNAVTMFWEEMGNQSRNTSVMQAFEETRTRRSMWWGPNGLIDIGEPESDDYISVQGGNNGLNARLEP